MRNTPSTLRLSSRLARSLIAAALLTTYSVGHSQNIERMRMSDGDMTCAQIFAEAQQMDTMIRLAASMPAGAQQAPAQQFQQAQQGSQAAAQGGNLFGNLLGAAAAQRGGNGGNALAGLFGGGNAAATNNNGANALAGLFGAAQGNNANNPLAALAGAAQGNNNANNAFAALQGQLGNLTPQQRAQLEQGMGQAVNQANAAGLGAFNQMANNPEAMRQLMLQSPDPRVRAAANDPAAMAQYQAVMSNPNLAIALARAQQQGVNTAGMQGAMGLLGGLQGLANNQAAQGQQAAPQNAVQGLFGALGARGGNAGNAAGALGGLFGAAQAAAPAAAAQMQNPAPAMSANTGAQAQGRKEHLTNLFLSKGCKMSDVNR